MRLTTLGAHRHLRFERTLGVARHRVWPAVSSAQGLAAWFPAHIEDWQQQIGHPIRLDGRLGVITALHAPHSVGLTWGRDLIRVELQEPLSGTLLILSHTIDESTPIDLSLAAAGWQASLELLEQALLISL